MGLNRDTRNNVVVYVYGLRSARAKGDYETYWSLKSKCGIASFSVLKLEA